MKMIRLRAVACAAILLLGACGNDDDEATDTTTTTAAENPTTTEAESEEVPAFCQVGAEIDEQDGPPNLEQLEALEAAAPEELADEMALIVERFADIGEEAFEEPEVGQGIGVIEAWEAENCPQDEAEVVEPDPDAAQVPVTADDYSFEIDGEVPAGKVAFIMENVGDEPHEMDLVRLNDGTTAEQLEAAAEEGLEAVEGLVMDEEIGSSATAASGETVVVNAELEPGVYGAGCFVRSPDGMFHFEKGMRTLFTVS
jgi:hypothetical protein